jgi:hypothetical protein
VSDSEAPAPQPATPEKGVADVLKEAYALYRKHAGALIVTCLVLMVPASIVKSCAVAVITGPAVVSTARGDEMEHLREVQRRLQEAYERHADQATIEKLKQDFDAAGSDLKYRAAAEMGSFTNRILGFLADLFAAFVISGLVVPLIIAAMSIAVVDRLLGGQAGWREVWTIMSRRRTQWLTAAVPAAAVVAFGYIFFIPGVILGLLFSFLSPVVLLEGLRGQPAIQRSTHLVLSDWLRIALMFIVLTVACWLTAWVANLLVPRPAIFFGSLLGDVATAVVLPLPAIGLVLLYLDVRRKRDGYTDERLRADFEALKTG